MKGQARYELLKFRLKRRKTEYVIISHIRNFYEKEIPVPPIAKLGTYKLTAPLWEYYFCKDLAPKYKAKGFDNAGFPYHYFVELVDNDYQITLGLPEYSPSYYTEILINAGILPAKYANSVIIAVKEDFSIDVPEIRLWEQMSQKLLTPILLRYPMTMDRQNIVYLDDIIDKENIDVRLKEAELKLDYAEALFFDRMFLKLSIDKYATVRT